eukprot:GHVN01043686.1.p1 GENE.GHVN01043686.1~~GHVN01043686.1.p1  ORF type:complete len:441 (-),score=84.96 GHVN01043686.1:131-1453(-)
MSADPATKHARKIYVGNLPVEASEASIIAFFNESLQNLLPNKPPGNVIIGCYLNAQRRFGFIEHRSIEEANFTLGLDGINFGGVALKLRRPQDFNPSVADSQLNMELQQKGGMSAVMGAKQVSTPAVPAGDLVAGALGIVSTTVEDSPNKVFIGGLPHHLNENEVKQILSSFGTLKSFHLVKQESDTEKSKGFAFCEWRDGNTTDLACQALNGMAIGERVLNVRRALPHAVHKATSDYPTTSLTPLTSTYTEIMHEPIIPVSSIPTPTSLASAHAPLMPTPNIGGPHANALNSLNATIGPPPASHSAIGRISRILGITNMMPPDPNTEELDRIVAEAKSECAKLGQVRSVEYWNDQILVAFSQTQEAVQAMKALQGRQFDGRLLNCTFAEASPQMKTDAVMRAVSEVSQAEGGTHECGDGEPTPEREPVFPIKGETDLEN